MSNYNYHRGAKGSPIYHWTKGVGIEDKALKQLENMATMPFVHHHVSAMPDVHWGLGATIGSVFATTNAITPSSVGVDLGCGMSAIRLSLKAEQLPDNLHAVRGKVENAVPHGRTDNGGANDKGAFKTLPARHLKRWKALEAEYDLITAKHPKSRGYNNALQMGTLGGGNHFWELCIDENDDVWVLLHTGSRGAGNKIGQYFIEKAKLEMERYHIAEYLPDRDLSYLVEHTEIFDDYVQAVDWAQRFAKANRDAIMDASLAVLKDVLPPFIVTETAINCHHNYIEKEFHYGKNVWVTRKGAVRARKGDLGIIPGSMGTGSFIVEGLGNKESFCSCSHGAGRVMSRGEAKKLISLDDHKKAMNGIEARLDKDVLDESPAAYKDIGAVMKAQEDLVEIKYRLRQVINIKG